MNWKRKLGSRKLWCAVAAWLTSILTSFGVTENIIAQIVLIISGIGALAVYIIAETAIDKECGNKKNGGIGNEQVH